MTAAATFGPCLRVWRTIVRLCCLGMRRQMSQAVKATPIGPAPLIGSRATGGSLALRAVVLAAAAVAAVATALTAAAGVAAPGSRRRSVLRRRRSVLRRRVTAALPLVVPHCAALRLRLVV